MISLQRYIIENNNLDNIQNKIDEIEPNDTNQMEDMTADSIKSFIINNDSFGNPIVIVEKTDEGFLLKFSKDNFLDDASNISERIIKICEYFKTVFGAPFIKIDNKKYTLMIARK